MVRGWVGRRRGERLAFGAAIAFLGACGQGTEVAAPGEVVELASPAGADSGEPFLTPGRGGTVLLSWLERRDSAHELRFARFDGQSWSKPKTIARSDRFFVNWADFPSLLELKDGRLLAHWLERSSAGKYSYDVRLALSSDDGDTWSAAITPHRDGTPTEHGFASLFETEQGAAAVWLDGRKYAPPGEGLPPPEEMSVYFATLDGAGRAAPEISIDGRSCDCCQTDVAVTEVGPIVVYRDRSDAEVRDIVISRFLGGRWSDPTPVHEDGWVINSCPVNGPAVAARGSAVAVAWFTAARDTSRVQVAFSDDAGASFGPPIRLDGGDPVGRVDAVLLADGSAIVSWLERMADGAMVLARHVMADGRASATTALGESSAERPSGFPRLVMAGDRLIAAWTKPEAGIHVSSGVVR